MVGTNDILVDQISEEVCQRCRMFTPYTPAFRETGNSELVAVCQAYGQHVQLLESRCCLHQVL